jgi:hypothetical protein
MRADPMGHSSAEAGDRLAPGEAPMSAAMRSSGYALAQIVSASCLR